MKKLVLISVITLSLQACFVCRKPAQPEEQNDREISQDYPSEDVKFN